MPRRTPTPPMTDAEHRAWWAERTDVPYGFCWCGCGQATHPATHTSRSRGVFKGLPTRFIHGHTARNVGRRLEAEILLGPNPSGLCMCGCGELTPPARQTNTRLGWVRGKPIRYVVGHTNGKLTASQETQIVSRYAAGETAKSLADDFGTTFSSVYKLLKQRRATLQKTGWATEHEKGQICRRYCDGENTYALAAEFNVDPATIQYLLESQGIARRPLTENHRKYACNKAFFDSIDSEVKAYTLGFIAADGCVITSPKGRPSVLSITLAERDKDHLLRLRNAMGSEHPIRRVAFSGYSSGFGASLAVSSVELCEALVRADITPQKTFTHDWPDFLPPDLLRHYLRGYFDGDGWFSAQASNYVRKSDGGRGTNVHWGIVGSDAFCRAAQSFLVTTVSVAKTKIGKEGPGISRLVYGGNRQVARIYNLMYDDATIWLPRKREVAAPYVA
jgi:hypothetical protein